MFVFKQKKRKLKIPRMTFDSYEHVPRIEKLPVSIIYTLMLFVAGDCSPEVS